MFDIIEKDGFTIIKLAKKGINSLDINNIDAMKKSLDELINAGKNKILVNFSNINYIDSSGLGGLMDAMKKLKNKGGELGILSISKDVLEVFAATKVAQFFKFYKSI